MKPNLLALPLPIRLLLLPAKGLAAPLKPLTPRPPSGFAAGCAGLALKPVLAGGSPPAEAAAEEAAAEEEEEEDVERVLGGTPGAGSEKLMLCFAGPRRRARAKLKG